jgi:hypothetical protein
MSQLRFRQRATSSCRSLSQLGMLVQPAEAAILLLAFRVEMALGVA